jgi:hypothetical protein
MEKRTHKTMRIKFYPSLLSRTRDTFYKKSKSFFDYLKKLTQEKGISFLIGIAVGVNMILLLQMSEDIISKLSEPLTGSILGIAGIVSIIVIGVTIVYMQKKAGRRINTLIEQQQYNKIIEDENKRDKELRKEVNNEL